MGNIDAVLIASESGFPIFSRYYSEKNIDENLLLSFFSALKSFSRSFLQHKKKKELRSIHLGNSLFNFENITFEHLGQVDVLLISTGIDPTTSKAVLSQITEMFTIYLDEIFLDNPDKLITIKRGLIPDFLQEFSPQLDMIVDSLQTEDSFSVDVNLNIPIEVLTFIDELFQNDLPFAETYDFDVMQLLDQILGEYAQGELEKDIKKRFKKKKYFII